MSHLRTAFRIHRTLILLTLVYMGAVTGAVFYEGGSTARFVEIIETYCLSVVLVIFFILAVFSVFMGRAVYETRWRGSVGKWLGDVLRRFEVHLEKWVARGMLHNALMGLLATAPLLMFFSMAKSLIPVISPFHLDPTLSAIDHAVHFGHYPDRILRGIFAWTGGIGVLDSIYMLWFAVMFTANGFALFCDTDLQRRMRYLWSFTLCWIVSGTVLALLFSSCGPVFFHLYYPDIDNPYSGLLGSLSDRQAVTYQAAQMLYQSSVDPDLPDFNGISAMPSQHVAVAWLIALYGWSIDKRVGAAAFVHAAAILVASIALGWHYAIDGYVGIAVVSILWWICGRKLRVTAGSSPATAS